jgi:hypothetical protein
MSFLRRLLPFALLAVAVPGVADANGRFPTALQLATRPGHKETLGLRATFGVLYSTDEGKNWDWICESAMGYGMRSDYLLAMTEKGSLMVAALEGLAMSRDGGCNWSFAGGPLEKKEVTDITIFGADSNSVMAITFNGQIAVSDDQGVNWTPRGVVDPSVRPVTIDVAPSDPSRVYVTALRSNGTTLSGVFFVSIDGGEHFDEHPIALLAEERAAYIAAIDPKNADRVYLRTGDDAGALPSRLLLTDNAGVSFSTPYTGEQMLGFALADEGKKVFLGGVQNGLLVANSTDLIFTPRSPLPVQCLASNADGLWACSNETDNGFFIGASSDDGAAFAERLRKKTVRGPLACASDSSVARCTAEWPSTQYLLGMLDGGLSDAGPVITLDGGDYLGKNKGKGTGASDDGCGTSPLAPAGTRPRDYSLAALGSLAFLASAFAWRARTRRRG